MSRKYEPLQFSLPSGYGTFQKTEYYTEENCGTRPDLIGRGYHVPTSLYICPDCGAVVEDTMLHRVWHEGNEEGKRA